MTSNGRVDSRSSVRRASARRRSVRALREQRRRVHERGEVDAALAPARRGAAAAHISRGSIVRPRSSILRASPAVGWREKKKKEEGEEKREEKHQTPTKKKQAQRRRAPPPTGAEQTTTTRRRGRKTRSSATTRPHRTSHRKSLRPRSGYAEPPAPPLAVGMGPLSLEKMTIASSSIAARVSAAVRLATTWSR